MPRGAMPEFVPGLALSEAFYREAVRPLLERDLPGLPHAAALIGAGSEVLGFDTPLSTDHHWGPRVMLFLRPGERRRYAEAIDESMREGLPYEFRGYSTHYTPPQANGSQVMAPIRSGPVNHRVEVLSLRAWFAGYLGWDIEADLEPADWLTFPEQKLRSLSAGAVFHDDVGLGRLRDRLRRYPHDVWLYLLAAGWTRISQEEHLVGRAGDLGDELGSRLIAARLVRDLMRLCFLMEREFAPYAKWLGTAFSRLRCAAALRPSLDAALRAPVWRERETALCNAYRQVAALHNGLGVTPPLPTEPCPFYERPFRVIHGETFARALRDAIRDERVQRLARRRLIGSIDQFSDSTDLTATEWRGVLRRLYE